MYDSVLTFMFLSRKDKKTERVCVCVCAPYLKAVLMVLEASIVVHETIQLFKALVRLFCLKGGSFFFFFF